MPKAEAGGSPITGVGLGLRWQFLDEVLAGLDDPSASPPPVDFFEVAPENYMRRGGYFPAMLARVAERFALLSHGLTMSIGSVDPLDGAYLAELRRFLGRFDLPFTREAARHAVRRVRTARERIERPLAIENITYYLVPGEREMDEATFLREVLEGAECGLLLDVNNAHVNAQNHGEYDPITFLSRLPLDRVVGLHVAGHEREGGLLIDTHGADAPDPVIDLVAWVIERTGPLPVVVERDNKIPAFEELLREVGRVRAAYDRGLAAWEGRPGKARAAGAAGAGDRESAA